MMVIGHEDYTYFLLRDGDAFYLDANCNHGPVGYSILIRLNDEEVARYRAEGAAYVRGLAIGIHNAVPIANPASEYALRNIVADSPIGKQVLAAIRSAA